MLVNFRSLFVTLSLGLANVAWSAPSIESIEISPDPLTTGQNFTGVQSGLISGLGNDVLTGGSGMAIREPTCSMAVRAITSSFSNTHPPTLKPLNWPLAEQNSSIKALSS